MEASSQQTQPRNEILPTTNDVSPRTVRTNWLRYSWSQISGATKVLLIMSIIIAIIQIATTVTILAIGGQRELSCEKPLQLYLIVFVVRVGLSSPLGIYQHLFEPRRRRRRGRGTRRGRRRTRTTEEGNNHNMPLPAIPQETQVAEEPVIATMNSDETASSAVPQPTNGSNNNAAVTQSSEQEQPQPQQQQQQRPSTLISGWVDKLRSLLDLFAILWFIVGNYLVFSPSTCSVNAGPYYYTILAWVLFGYTILLIPLLACASVIFCLPVILVALRTFNINVSNVMVGGSKEEIAKIPVFKYKAAASTAAEEEQVPGASSSTTYNKPPEASNCRIGGDKTSITNFIRRFMKRHQKQQQEEQSTTTSSSVNQYLTIPNVEDALCSICLSEYENDEIICKLWCQHHFHHECVAEWLALNSKCPLCKRDFRGKNYVENEEQDSDFEQEDDGGDEEEQV